MMLKSIPRIDVYQLTRNSLKLLKIKGSQGGQAQSLIEKTTQLALRSQAGVAPNDFSMTVPNSIARKLNII